MKQLITLLTIILSGCTYIWDDDKAYDMPPACFEHDGITYRTWYPDVHCPNPIEITEAVDLVLSITDETIRIFNNWDVLYWTQPYFLVDGDRAGATLEWGEKNIHIADTDYPIPALRHELFHIVQRAEDGNTDLEHTDERWDVVN